MLVNSVNVLSQNQALSCVKDNKKYGWLNNGTQDSFVKATDGLKPSFFAISGKNYIQVVSFGAKPPRILKLAIQMKVKGVTHFQDNMDPELIKNHNFFSINRLADSNWKDGDPLEFKLTKGQNGTKIALFSKKFGEIGRVHEEIADSLIDLLKANPKDYSFELSNVIAGNTKGAPTIGLRVNLLYNGNETKKVSKVFDEILNNPFLSDKVLFYQSKTSPKEILKQILRQEELDNGVAAAKQMQEVINNIVSQIDSPENKKILLVGHCKPDGDTLGCALGLKSSIDMVHPDKLVDCAVDDEVTGLFRNKLPGIDSTIKHPYSAEKIALLKNELKVSEKQGDTAKVNAVNYALSKAEDKNLLLDPNEKYDLVVLMDIPSPARFSSGFKDYIKNAKQVIYIDHHPFRSEEWDKTADVTGINMSNVIKNKLAWVASRVPAATEQVAIIASKLNPKNNPLNSANYIKAANSAKNNPKLNASVASFVTGMWTDTGGFARTANLLPTDIIDKEGNRVPVQARPNFLPEGFSKWLLSLTPKSINKKWLREIITYDISDKKMYDLPETAREIMVNYANEHLIDNKDWGVGFITASYGEMQDVLNVAKLDDLSTSFLDVQNAFKYSEAMAALKEPSKNIKKEDGTVAIKKVANMVEEKGAYDSDRIAVFICESEKKGDLNTEGEKSPTNALRFSFRSKEGSIYSELLASLFNGGGHGGAAGGHIKGDNVTLNSTFSVRVDGKKITDKETLFSALMENYKLKHDKDVLPEDYNQLASKIELIEDEKGENPIQIINGLVQEIRLEEEKSMTKPLATV